jgi:hypothetical protein
MFDASCQQILGLESKILWEARRTQLLRFFNLTIKFFLQQLLNDEPFHIDAMLQLSDICKMGEDSTRAAELIERTLYAMESAFHPLFNLAVGTSKLDYRRQENRLIFFFRTQRRRKLLREAKQFPTERREF